MEELPRCKQRIFPAERMIFYVIVWEKLLKRKVIRGRKGRTRKWRGREHTGLQKGIQTAKGLL